MKTPQTAEAMMRSLKAMSVAERVRFFSSLGAAAFENHSQNYSHADVFGEVNAAEFSAAEAAEYLEVSIPTFRRFVQGGKVVPTRAVGRNQFFAAAALKVFKRARREVRGSGDAAGKSYSASYRALTIKEKADKAWAKVSSRTPAAEDVL
jgi:hypothetical protein